MNTDFTLNSYTKWSALITKMIKKKTNSLTKNKGTTTKKQCNTQMFIGKMFASNDSSQMTLRLNLSSASESFNMIYILHYGHSRRFVLTVVRWHSNSCSILLAEANRFISIAAPIACKIWLIQREAQPLLATKCAQ